MAKATKSKPRARQNARQEKTDAPSVFQFVPGNSNDGEPRAQGPNTGNRRKDALLIGIMRLLSQCSEDMLADCLLSMSPAVPWTGGGWLSPPPPPGKHVARKREREANEE